MSVSFRESASGMRQGRRTHLELRELETAAEEIRISVRLYYDSDRAKGSTDMHARPPAQNVILQWRE